MISRFAHWYLARLKDMGIFAAGYIVGGIVVAFFITFPKIAFSVLGGW